MTRQHVWRGYRRAAMALAVGLSAAPGSAADLAGFGLSDPPYGLPGADMRRVVTVVPACSERRWAMLLHCQPRENVFVVDDVGLAAIQRSIDRGRPPYRELVRR